MDKNKSIIIITALALISLVINGLIQGLIHSTEKDQERLLRCARPVEECKCLILDECETEILTFIN